MTPTTICAQCHEEKRKASLDLLLFGTSCLVPPSATSTGEHVCARHIPVADYRYYVPEQEA